MRPVCLPSLDFLFPSRSSLLHDSSIFANVSFSGFVATMLTSIAVMLATSTAVAGDLIVVTIDGSINQASAEYLIDAIKRAETEDASAVLIELDTPGGFVVDTQDIIQAMLNSTVPTIVYVTPRGASATSAGTFITIAANIAAMMPGTSIGAAHPVIPGAPSYPSPSPDSAEEEEEGGIAEPKHRRGKIRELPRRVYRIHRKAAQPERRVG